MWLDCWLVACLREQSGALVSTIPDLHPERPAGRIIKSVEQCIRHFLHEVYGLYLMVTELGGYDTSRVSPMADEIADDDQ